MLTGGDDKGSCFFIKRPIVVFAAIATSTAVVEIVVITNQVSETPNSLGPIVINAEIQIRRTAIRLAAVHTNACKFSLQIAFIGPVVFEPAGSEPPTVFCLGILKQHHS